MMMSYEFPFTLTSNNDVFTPFHKKRVNRKSVVLSKISTT